MKKILGLDLGTNSIGWAVLREEGQEKAIEAAGSRIIPMDAATIGDFNKGNSISQTAERTRLRGVRRLQERYLLRRERLHRVLNLLDFLPPHYAKELDRYGHIKPNREPKLAWRPTAEQCVGTEQDCPGPHIGNRAGKYEFLFQNSFHEMLAEFSPRHPHVQGQKIPYDWTLYYLRNKALTKPVTKEELAWILLNFNQKRGYNQLRGEEEEAEESNRKRVEYQELEVIAVEVRGAEGGAVTNPGANPGPKTGAKDKDTWYHVLLENGYIYKRTSKTPLYDWVGKKKAFIITTKLNPDGTPEVDKEGEVKRSFRAPNEDDWMLIKKKAEDSIDKSGKTVGTYIYEALLQNPSQKIRGGLVRTIERKYYKEELQQILATQKAFHPQFQDRALYEECLMELYPSNEAHRSHIAGKDLAYLLVEDILFYQRPLKSKKSLIANCPYETYAGHPVKCIPKSHPLFQEFRLWQFVSNLRIFYKEGNTEKKITEQFLNTPEQVSRLFDWLNDRKTIKQKDLLTCPLLGINKKEAEKYRWNYVEDKEYPCNETRGAILDRLDHLGMPQDFLTPEREMALWHILYSVNDKTELKQALRTFARKQSLEEPLAQSFVEKFAKFPPFAADYGSYSAKAIKKLLPLMRTGAHWNPEAIDPLTKERIDKLLTGEFSEQLSERVRDNVDKQKLTSLEDFQGLPVWLVCYVVYGRHSEAKEIQKWESPADIDAYLQQFKQHSLRNPIVEQVITETLRTVRDIWKRVGQIDEIHVELGREMKRHSKEREEMTKRLLENENTNMRIKCLLTEFLNPEYDIENVLPYSPSQQDILRLYEEGALASVDQVPEDIARILKNLSDVKNIHTPNKAEVMRYRLWLEQKYRSPYTGRPIPLGKLFTPAYEIEHIIPQSLYFDDSFSNKVICESEVNKLKGNKLGYEFISKCHGQIVQLSGGTTVTIFSVDEYERFVNDFYSSSTLHSKKKKLLMSSIPDSFIERQLNDSRYISRVVLSLLSNIVREEDEQEATSKHVIPCTGAITDRLKKDWGIKDVWNRIILPRFRRLNQLTGDTRYTARNTQGHEITAMPLELQKGFNRKRIDHRHHAMDAIVIACTTRSHVQLLNNENAKSGNEAMWHHLSQKLRRQEVVLIDGKPCSIYKEFLLPWEGFPAQVYQTLEQMVVSFKSNLRVINKTTNYYQHYNAEGKKEFVAQCKGDSWSIRKSMHKDTVFGEVNLRLIEERPLSKVWQDLRRVVDKELRRQLLILQMENYSQKMVKQYFEEHKDSWGEVNLSHIPVYCFANETKSRYYATRKGIDDSFTKATIAKVTDSGIRQILERHLAAYNGNAAQAFSPQGVEEMNKNIKELNGGKPHQPIFKVRVYEEANKYAIGSTGNKRAKFVEGAKGTNLFFAVYEKDGKRSYETISFVTAMERLKQGLEVAPSQKEGALLRFVLSPQDLVYVPTAQELSGAVPIPQKPSPSRIYKMVSCTGSGCHFVPHAVAIGIVDKVEFSKLNKMERATTGEMIKEICLPLKVNRLGEYTISLPQND